MALRYAGSCENAEDLTQETFYTAYKKFEQLKDPKKCKAWLLAILRNIYLRERESIGRKDEYLACDEESYASVLERAAAEEKTPESDYEIKTQTIRVIAIIGELPEKLKTPLLLFFQEDMPYQEISETLDIPIGTVMSRISRAKKQVKKAIIKDNLQTEPGAVILKADFGKAPKRAGRL